MPSLNIDENYNEENQCTLSIQDDGETARERLNQILMQETVEKLCKHITEREELVIKKRFGIGFDESTLQEVGDYLNVSRERARQIENKAIGKMREHATVKDKAGFN